MCELAICVFFFSSRRRHTRCSRDWSSDVCSSDLQGDERLSRRVHYASSRLVPYSPASGPRAGDGGGMTISELCEAAVVLSDNTAANLLLDASGGPQALTQWLRAKIGRASCRERV